MLCVNLNENVCLLFLFVKAMADSKENEYIQKMIKENPVMMFSKTTCSYCAMAKKVLDGIGVSYVVEEIDLREDCDQLQNIFKQLTGARTVSLYAFKIGLSFKDRFYC